MTSSEVLQWADRPRGTRGPAFELSAAKLLRPWVRPGTVSRSSVIERMTLSDPVPIVSVVAPAGYGKTTLLSQWAEHDARAVAWVSVDEGDNDPRVLFRYVAEALDAVEPVGQWVFAALASPSSSVPGSVVPWLSNAFAAMTMPVALVLDDVHLLHNTECQAALSVLADHVPAGSRLVLAGRAEPPLRMARLRAQGRILEIGTADLSLSGEEASALLRAVDVGLAEDEASVLHRRTEGWPVALYLAALYLRQGGSLRGAVASFGGDDRFVSQYLESEFLGRITEAQRRFLTRTAVLERMSGPLCEAVLDQPGSAATLADLADSNLLLVPLDRRGQWYRYHHLFRDMLLADLERMEPELIPVLRRRAADWYERNGRPEEALEYSMAAEDVETAARLTERVWLPTERQGRVTTVERWCGWLDDRGGLERHPILAVAAAKVYATMGRPIEAERWADAVDRWQYGDQAPSDDPYTKAWAAVLRAMLCRRGAKQMRADADEAVDRFTALNIPAPVGALLQGVARVLCGDPDGGDASLEDAVNGAKRIGSYEILADALCERSLVAMARNDWDRTEALAAQAGAALSGAGIEDSYLTPLICAVKARAALHRRDVAAARQELIAAQRLRPVLTYASPHLAVRARIELAHAHLALADVSGARTLMREIDEVLTRRPGLGTLVEDAEGLRSRLAKDQRANGPGASALTAAELRLLPMLSTHLSFPQIGQELFLSRHTIKTQADSIYRKLGANARSQAVSKARELGLLEA